MQTIQLSVTNDTGLHSRPADLFVRTAKLYTSKITVQKGEKSADAKNILKLILLNVSKDSEISITADGDDEQQAIEDLRQLVESDFTKINPAVKL